MSRHTPDDVESHNGDETLIRDEVPITKLAPDQILGVTVHELLLEGGHGLLNLTAGGLITTLPPDVFGTGDGPLAQRPLMRARGTSLRNRRGDTGSCSFQERHVDEEEAGACLLELTRC